MLRLARKALPLGMLFVLFAQTGAQAATVGISIVSTPSPGAFMPGTANLTIGDTAQWTNNSNNIHSSTGDSPLSFWDTGTFTNGQSRSKQFVAAGTYPYHCSVHSGMHGTVTVKMTVSPANGTTSTVFTIAWASATIPTGFNVDVQYSRNGSAFANAVVNRTGNQISAQGMVANPGTYQLRARIQKTSNGAASGYSPPVTFVVS